VLTGALEGNATITACYQRSEPAAAKVETSIGDGINTEGVAVKSVYTLAENDKAAKPLSYLQSMTDTAYKGFDFDTVWTLDENAEYPFPVLQENLYTGIATYGVLTDEPGAMGYAEYEKPRSKGTPSDTGTMSSMTATYPSAYDLRTVGILPAVRDQGDYGSCWAHASIAALESNMVKNGLATKDINLSEMHTVYFTNRGARIATSTWNDPLNNFDNDHAWRDTSSGTILELGNNAWFATHNFATGMTPPPETTATAYNTTVGNTIVSSGLDYTYAFDNNRVHIKGVRIAYASNRNSVKALIMNYGAVAASYRTNSNYYSSAGAFYIPQDSVSNSNHAIAIVGWDDNYDRNKFLSTCKPGSNGAWLVRNSWGSDWGPLGGYFWASYESDEFATTPCFAVIAEQKNAYDYCYEYDGSLGNVFEERDYATVYSANVFTVTNGSTTSALQKLNAVGFWCSDDYPCNYAIDVYKLTTTATTPTSGTKLTSSSVTGTTAGAGFYKVALPLSTLLNQGDRFSVVVKLTTSYGTAWLDYEETDTSFWLDSYSYARLRQSYSSDNGTYWVDMNSATGATTSIAKLGRSLTIKAYTDEIIPVTSVDISAADNKTSVAVGATLQLGASVLPTNANQNVLWTITSGTSYATISSSGLLTGKGSGTVTVKATTVGTDINGNTLNATKTITVYTPVTGVTVSPSTVRIIMVKPDSLLPP
jgi:C1A family cysteine protease